MGRLRPTFVKTINVIQKSRQIFELEKKHRGLFSTVNQETGLGINNARDVAYLYKSLQWRASRNSTLPVWTNGIFPNGEMLNVTYLEDQILSKTNIQRKLNGGTLIRKILMNSAANTDNLSDNGRKIMIYSGDSDLFVGVLHNLGAWYLHVPNIASSLIFELLQDSESHAYKMKIFYDLGKDNLRIPLNIPGCGISQDSTGCPFESLVLSLVNVLPEDDQALCGRGYRMAEIPFEENMAVEMIFNDTSRSACGVFFVSCLMMLTSAI